MNKQSNRKLVQTSSNTKRTPRQLDARQLELVLGGRSYVTGYFSLDLDGLACG